MINKDIKKALKHENRKAMKFQAKNKVQNDSLNAAATSNGFENGNSHSRDNSKPRLKTPEGGFAKSRGIVMNKRKINYETSNKQYERVDNLVNLVQLEFEEFDNQLNLKPQTAHDQYFNKLQTFKIHNEMIQSNDDNIERDIQTDEIEQTTLAMQCPEDLFETKKSVNQDLDGFISRVTPVMEMVLEENIQLADLANPQAKNKNPVEQKAKISCPIDLLKVIKSKIAYIS